MTIEHVETAIIGAGQAGLATAYHLQWRGRSCLILDSNDKVGDNWRAQWDSLRLYSPAQYDGLPGLPFPSPRWSYPTKDEVAGYLSAYAKRFGLPVRTLSRVDRLQAVDGKYTLRLGADRIIADNVVVATGTFGRTPNIPDFALDLDPSIRQLHSSEYRNPAQLKPGPVLVRLDRWTMRLVFPAVVFLGRHVLTRRTPIGRKALEKVRFHGGPNIRVKRSDLRDRGVERILDRVTGVQDGRPMLADGRVLDVANVV